jgi:hypothetical protein
VRLAVEEEEGSGGAVGEVEGGAGCRELVPCSGFVLCCLREKGEKEKREKRKIESEGKNKRRKNGNIFQTWKFLGRKIKDLL